MDEQGHSSAESHFGVAENDSGRASSAALNSERKDPAAIEPKSRSCRGCLYYSNSLRDSGRNPVCIGLSRAESQGLNMIGQTEWEVTKDGKKLSDFKYACVGYASHKERHSSNAPSPMSSAVSAESHAELPLCVGLEFLVDKRASRGQTAQHHGQSPVDMQRDPWREDGGQTTPAHQSPTLTRPSLSDDDFPARFVRCAKLVASGVVRNSERVAGAMKAKLDEIVYPDRGKPKR